MNIFITYIRESLEELRQVRWPTQHQAIRLTTIVIVFIVITSAFFGLVDAGFMQIIRSTIRL
jgi:preprotein translocase SecE subunit